MPLLTEIPQLHTARLRLRAPSVADLADAVVMWGNVDVVRYLGGKPHTREEVWTRLLRMIGHWHALGYGYWAMETRPDGAFAGVIGFGDMRRDMEPNLDGVPEMGWVLARTAQGRGLASEAGAAALRWRDDMLPAGDTVCIIDPANAASMRVAEKLGFAPRLTTAYHGRDTILLTRGTPA